MKNVQNVSDEFVISKIYLIRNRKVMIDRDLAELYGVETRRLKEQVRRNLSRFPEDFMFELTKEELEKWRSQFATSKREKMGLRRPPFVFTEHGVLMLSSVLNSQQAIQMNIRIMRIFSKMREMILSHKDLLPKIEKLEFRVVGQDEKIKQIFKYQKTIMHPDRKPRNRIGFKK